LKKLGIFGGTFDPIHHGHLILAREAKETLELDTVIFIPATVSPHKQNQRLASSEIRLEMLRRAIGGESGFEIDTMELNRPPPSYAVDTMEALRQRYPMAEFFFLIGDDHVTRLPTWHRFEQLAQIVQFIVLDRFGTDTAHPYPVIQRHIDISSTIIRNRVAAGRSIRYLVPPPVEQVIHSHQLYRESKQ
jgi:nicotinate-nucleotide adenylyltransferase